MQIPVCVRNLQLVSLVLCCSQHSLTPSALIFASGGMSLSHSFVLGISITPSMIACATWTPWGANSLAALWDRALNAYFPVEKDDILALLLTDAVAPVKMRVGGYFDEVSLACLSSSGIVAWEKRKAPLL